MKDIVTKQNHPYFNNIKTKITRSLPYLVCLTFTVQWKLLIFAREKPCDDVRSQSGCSKSSVQLLKKYFHDWSENTAVVTLHEYTGQNDRPKNAMSIFININFIIRIMLLTAFLQSIFWVHIASSVYCLEDGYFFGLEVSVDFNIFHDYHEPCCFRTFLLLLWISVMPKVQEFLVVNILGLRTVRQSSWYHNLVYFPTEFHVRISFTVPDKPEGGRLFVLPSAPEKSGQK